jgi:hypothetical protein
MLGRKTYTPDEIECAREALARQLAAYDELVRAANEAADAKVSAAIESFQALFFNNLVLVLDRYFVHRLPGADYEGKDGNPLNEVRLVSGFAAEQRGKAPQRQTDQAAPGSIDPQTQDRRPDQARQVRLRPPLLGVPRRAPIAVCLADSGCPA